MFIRKTLNKLAATSFLSLFGLYVVLKSQRSLDNNLKIPSSDYGRLIDLVDFEFKINHPGCSKLRNDPKIVIMVHSAPGNGNKRRVIRETWGVKDDRSLLLFVIGVFNDAELEIKIERESRMFEDIVQGNFLDSYRNLTYKHAAVLKWFVYSCPNAKFLLKTDDDVFVNTPLILDLLSTRSNQSQELHNENLIFCKLFNGYPIRNNGSKWFVLKEEFAGDTFPDYCSGSTILYSVGAVIKLYKAVQTLPYFFIDDVHITGTARIQANLSRSTDARVLKEPIRSKILNGTLKVESHQVMFAFIELDEGDIRRLWKMFNGH